jgi:hypothetical protein
MIRLDWYVRSLLTVIAAALVYLCIVLTPLPPAHAQAGRVPGARTPGESTGPGEMVIVGWRLPPGTPPLPVDVPAGVNARIAGEVRVTGRVETQQQSGVVDRVMLSGWESDGRAVAWSDAQKRALPVAPR